jgi:hypothetical protein
MIADSDIPSGVQLRKNRNAAKALEIARFRTGIRPSINQRNLARLSLGHHQPIAARSF